uniref:Uncharacterized protein n=1 Tax=Tanacetum cinerariifolium TaxID=118510 RepID=A0A6L2MSH1_TANCI|nr:hypothetical protein [Tanacetum cinerariifolium]
MDHQYPTVAKIPVLDTGKFEQWQFQIQQYLQHEHYALWEVIEFRDSYVVPANTSTTDTTSGEKSGRTVTLTAEDMQRKKNDVKARTTLLLSLPNEHQLRFTKHNSRKEDGNTACVPTTSTNVPTASASIATISQDNACAYIASQSSDQFWKKTGKKISIQGSDVAGFDKSKDRGRTDNYRQGSKAEEQAPKALMVIDRVGWDWSYMANDEEDHALVADEVAPTEFALMANTSAEKCIVLGKDFKLLEEREGVAAKSSGDDAPIKRRSMDEEEAATKRISDDSKEMATVLTSMDAATILASEVIDVPTGSGSIPTASTPAKVDVPTGSDVVPTASPVFATATVVTPVTRRKDKEVMVESKTPKKQKVQEQIDAQVARELEEQLEREDQRRAEQIARDAEVARIHVEEEMQNLPIERRVELISDLVKYQDNYTKIYKFQSQQRKPQTKKQKRDYYMAVIRSNLGWKVKDFRDMTFEEVEAKFNSVWKQIEDFIPMEEVTEEAKSHDEVSEEKVKEMMQLVPIEDVYVEALQVKHPIIDWQVYTEGQRSYWKITRLGGSSASYYFFIDLLKHLDREDLNQLWRLVKETLSNRPPTSDKEMELRVELNMMYEPDKEDQLWSHTHNFMHALLDWKLYDSCGVHHVTSKDKEIFMLVEKDYPLRKGLALVMICYKLQVENFSQMVNDLVLKIYKIANSPRQ